MKKLFHEYLLIKPKEAKSKTESGFEIPDKKGKETEVAEVLMVSEDVDGISIGDNILYKSYSVDIIDIDDKTNTFIKFEDVIAIL